MVVELEGSARSFLMAFKAHRQQRQKGASINGVAKGMSAATASGLLANLVLLQGAGRKRQSCNAWSGNFCGPCPERGHPVQAAEAKKASTNGAAHAAGNTSTAGLLADLALLQGARVAGTNIEDDSEAGPMDGNAAQQADGAGQWKPPEDQRGDGRTKLNDLLGY